MAQPDRPMDLTDGTGCTFDGPPDEEWAGEWKGAEAMSVGRRIGIVVAEVDVAVGRRCWRQMQPESKIHK